MSFAEAMIRLSFGHLACAFLHLEPSSWAVRLLLTFYLVFVHFLADIALEHVDAENVMADAQVL